MSDPAEYIQVAGKSSIYIGLAADRDSNGDYSAMLKIGEQLDDTRVAIQNFFHDVPGDRYGGAQGPPIERQFLGQIATVQFNLTRWSQAARRYLEKHNTLATNGAITDAEIGSLILRDRAFRLVIVPAKTNTIPEGVEDAGDDYFAYNFPCAVLSSPVEVGQGTKFSMLQFTMEAHRAPDGHPNEGVLFNRSEELPT